MRVWPLPPRVASPVYSRVPPTTRSTPSLWMAAANERVLPLVLSVSPALIVTLWMLTPRSRSTTLLSTLPASIRTSTLPLLGAMPDDQLPPLDHQVVRAVSGSQVTDSARVATAGESASTMAALKAVSRDGRWGLRRA